LDDFKKCENEAVRLEAALQQGESAVAEALKATLGGVLTEKLDVLVKPFGKSLIGSLVKKVLSEVFPKNVRDLATAALWVELTIAPDLSTRNTLLKPSWEWEFRESGTPSETPPDIAMEKTVAAIKGELKSRERAEAIRLQNEQAEAIRLQNEWRLDPLRSGESRRPGEVSGRGEPSGRPAEPRPPPQPFPRR
jgi:hypothetical protein